MIEIMVGLGLLALCATAGAIGFWIGRITKRK